MKNCTALLSEVMNNKNLDKPFFNVLFFNESFQLETSIRKGESGPIISFEVLIGSNDKWKKTGFWNKWAANVTCHFDKFLSGDDLFIKDVHYTAKCIFYIVNIESNK